MRIARVIGIGGAALALGASAPAALAHGAGELTPITLPPFPPGDGAKAQAAIKELEDRVASDPARASIVGDALLKAKTALQRAFGARNAGDHGHARQLEGLALEWVGAAQALDRAAASEAAARAAAKKADEAVTQVERVRALLSETEARKARAATELERVRASAKTAEKGAAEAEQARIDAAKGAGKAPPGDGKPPAKKDGK